MTALEQRLEWIEPNHFERGNDVRVIERTKGGEGTATFRAPANSELLRFNLSEDNRLRLLKQRRVADGILVELGDDGRPSRLHLVELKSQVTTSEWKKVKQQLLGALHNAHALMGLLGLSMPENIECHTCYKTDQISPKTSAQPVMFKTGVGVKASGSRTHDWLHNYCKLSEEFPRMRHHRHCRDEDGNAQVEL